MEMNIAIVDDSSEERDNLINILSEHFYLNRQLFEVIPVFYEFESGEDFLEDFQKSKFQLILLDIYMHEFSGIDVAERIRSLDRESNIIFTTTSMDHMLDGYEVNAIGYVIKPITKDCPSLYTAISRVMERLDMDSKNILFETKFGDHRVTYRNIIYFECSQRDLYLHFTSGTILVSGKYSDYAEQLLSNKCFVECYRNIIVNMDFIDTPAGDDLILKTGEKLPISRRKKKDLLERYTAYFIERGCI